MNRKEIFGLLDDEGENNFNRDDVMSMLEGKTGIDIPGKTETRNDVLPSEFQIPGGFAPEMDQAMRSEFGYNSQDKVDQEEQAVQQQRDMQVTQEAERKELNEAEQQRLAARPLMTRFSDFPAAVNAEVLTAVGIPGSLWETVGEMLDIEAMQNTGMTSKDIRGYGAKLGINYADKDVPNTSGTKMGSFLIQGIAFLLPVLRFGRAAGPATSSVTMVPRKLKDKSKSWYKAKSTQSYPKRMAQDMTTAFSQNAGKAWLAESSASLASGYGAFELGQRYGPTGEMYGSLAGMGPQLAIAGSKSGFDAMKRVRTSLQQLGQPIDKEMAGSVAGHKASKFIQGVTAKDDLAGDIKRNEIQTLPEAELSIAKLTGDEHMLALEKAGMVNPALYNEIKAKQLRTKATIRKEMEELGGNTRIEETQAYIDGSIQKTEMLLDERVKQALVSTKESLEPLSTSAELSDVNTIARERINSAKQVAKDIEGEKWDAVGKKVMTTTQSTIAKYKELLAEMEAFKSSDKADVPKFVKDILGFNKKTGTKETGFKKKYTRGSYNDSELLLDIKQFRTRISSEIEKTESKTQERFLTRLRDAVTEDMDAAQGSGVKEAVAASKYVHDTFEGGVMNTIHKVDKFGKGLDPNLTLDTVKTAGGRGLDAAVKIKKILDAAPESRDQLESLVKIQLANSNVLRKSTVPDEPPRINIAAAQRYLENNKDVLKLFPKIKKDLDFAIGQEQRFVGTKGDVDSKIKMIKESTEAKYRIDKRKPGQVLPEILSTGYPEKEMARVLAKSNKVGRDGIRNAVIKKMMDDSKMDGDKLRQTWNDNIKTYHQSFNENELRRLEQIIKTAELNKGLRGESVSIGEVMPPESLMITLTMKAAGLFLGHKTGQLTGSPLAATAGVMRYTQKLTQWMDSGRAKDIVMKSIDDPELFKALTFPVANLKKRHIQKLLAYQLTATLNAFEEQ